MSLLTDNPRLARIPNQAMTKKQWEAWMEETGGGRDFTDPWMELRPSKHGSIRTDPTGHTVMVSTVYTEGAQR